MARKGKAPAATTTEASNQVKENGTPAEESTQNNGEEAPKEVNGVVAAPAEDAPKPEGKEKKERKPLKRSVPEWATLSESARKAIPKANLAKPKVQDMIIEAIKTCADSKGAASAGAIRSFVISENPDLPKMVLKKGVLKALERGLIKQVKGKGFSGSFKLESQKNVAKAVAKDAKKKKAVAGSKDPLESVFPSVFTWATNPKQSSVGLIKKYIAKHYPDLDVEGKAFRNAIEGGEAKGQLKRLTGKGFSGTFELVDGANKTGAKYEDAIENAIISMNEPKEVSVTGLRDYLSCWHGEYDTDNKPKVLKSALDRCSERGWLQQISGKGFSGTYRLMYPYYPSPKDLWGKWYEEEKKETRSESPRKGKAKKTVEEEYDSDDSEDFSEDDEVMPTPRKRGAPTPRSSAAVAAKKKKVSKDKKPKTPAKKTKKPKKKSK